MAVCLSDQARRFDRILQWGLNDIACVDVGCDALSSTSDSGEIISGGMGIRTSQPLMLIQSVSRSVLTIGTARQEAKASGTKHNGWAGFWFSP